MPLASSLGLNCIISCSSPVQILGLLSLCNCTSQFLMINLSACLSVYIYMEIYILYLLLTFLVEARCFTGSCQFPLHSRAGRLYVSTCPLLDSLPFSHHRALMSSRCYPTSVHSRVNRSIVVSRCIPLPTPFSHCCPCLFSASVRLRHLCGWFLPWRSLTLEASGMGPTRILCPGGRTDLFFVPEHTYLFLAHCL